LRPTAGGPGARIWFFFLSGGDQISSNVSLQLTLAFASANANVPDVKPLTSGGTRAEERVSATQQLCSVLNAGLAPYPLLFLLRAERPEGEARSLFLPKIKSLPYLYFI
jgi:hypothetical protein